MSEIKNFIYFSATRKIKKKHIEDLFMGASMVDAIYIFADFDTAGKTCTIMFERSDGMRVGEVETQTEASEKVNPATGTEMPCFSYVIGEDALAINGELQITVRFYDVYTDPVTGIAEDQILTTALVTATVYPAVPTFGGQMTVISNLNRKINAVAESLQEHKQEFINHNHDTRYYNQDYSDQKYGDKLAVSGHEIILKNYYGAELSRITVPTTIQTQPPGELLHTGTGDYILDTNKKYIIAPVGASTIKFDIYLRVESPVDSTITYQKINTSWDLTFDKTELWEISFNYHVTETPGTYNIEINYSRNGFTEQKDIGNVVLGGLSHYAYPVIGINSSGFYQVFKFDIGE